MWRYLKRKETQLFEILCVVSLYIKFEFKCFTSIQHCHSQFLWFDVDADLKDGPRIHQNIFNLFFFGPFLNI